MFGLINMADYYCTFDKTDDILCQIKSILAVCFCILLIAKSGNETWCHDKHRLEGALCFPAHIPTKPANHPSLSHCTNECGKKLTRLSKEVIWGRIYRSCHRPCFGKHIPANSHALGVSLMPAGWKLRSHAGSRLRANFSRLSFLTQFPKIC